jgi:hypothetical protein
MRSVPVAVALLVAAASPAFAQAQVDRWSIDAEAVSLDVGGNDRLVLADRAVAAGGAATETTHTLDAGSALGYRAELHRTGARWRFGVDFLIFRTDQEADPVTGAAGGGAAQRIFVVGGGGQVVSGNPGERLYYQRLEDTTIELWSADFVASRAIAGRAGRELRLGLGLRAADFDNDYRAVAGIEGVGGLRLDASSNYDRMHGPLVALSGVLERGRNRFEGTLAQAVVFGDVELSSGLREFTGPPTLDVDADFPAIRSERFNRVQSVTIPMTELRLKWRFRLSDHIALGAGGFFAAWTDLAVPPGVEAGSTLDTLDENTLELFGASAGVTVRF